MIRIPAHPMPPEPHPRGLLMSDAQQLVVVTEDSQVIRSVCQVVNADAESQFEVRCYPLKEALVRFDESEVSAIFVDIDPGPTELLGELQQLAERAQTTEFFVVASVVRSELVLQAMRVGARDFLEKRSLSSTLPGLLRRLSVPATPNGQARHAVVSVFSASGGCGATTIAINLAHELHLATGSSVLLIDLERYYGGVAAHLSDLSAEFGVADVLEKSERIDAHLIKSTAVSYRNKWHTLLNPSATAPTSARQLNLKHLGSAIRSAKRGFTYTIVDAPRVELDTAAFLAKSSMVTLLVLEANVIDVRSARSQLEALAANGVDTKTVFPVVNRFRRGKQLLALDKVNKALQTDRVVQLTNDFKSVSLSMSYGKTLSEAAPRSAVRKELRKLARAIADARENESLQNVVR